MLEIWFEWRTTGITIETDCIIKIYISMTKVLKFADVTQVIRKI